MDLESEIDFGDTDSDSVDSGDVVANNKKESASNANGAHDDGDHASQGYQPIFFNKDDNDDDDDSGDYGDDGHSVNSDGSVFGEDGVLEVTTNESDAAAPLRSGVYERVEPKDTETQARVPQRGAHQRASGPRRSTFLHEGNQEQRSRRQLNFQSGGGGGVLPGAEGELSLKDHRLLADLVRGRRHAHLSLKERLQLQARSFVMIRVACKQARLSE